MPILALLVINAIRAYIFLIFIWVLGSWFPQWKTQPWYRFIEDIVHPYLKLFKSIPAQAGMIDFRPMLAIFALVLLEWLVAMSMSGV